MHDVGIFAKTTKSDVSYGVQTPFTKENRKKRNNMHQIVLNMPKENIQKNSDFFLFLFMCLCMWFACLCVLHLWRHIHVHVEAQSWIRNIPPLFFHFILEVWSLNQIQSMLVKATLSGNLAPRMKSEHWKYRWWPCPPGMFLSPQVPIQSSTFVYLASILNAELSL